MKNRKIIIFIIVLIALVTVIFGVWKWMAPKKIIKNQNVSVEYKKPVSENKAEVASWKEYKNNVYKCQINYPSDWYIFTEEADSDFAELKLNNNETVKQGGAVFWSNKDNINYTEENKPEDFLLLGLMIYEKANTNLDNFAKLLGFTQEVQGSSVIFKADNITGKEFISLGTSEENPRIAIIFQKENNFYVFHLGFVGENQENLKIMEKIAGSLKI